MWFCLLLVAVVVFIGALAMTSVWYAVRLIRHGALGRWRRRTQVILLAVGSIVGLYGTIGPVRVSSETTLVGFPLPCAVLLKAQDGTWIDYPSVYGGVAIFPPVNLVFWMGLLAAPINLVELARRRRNKQPVRSSARR